MITRHATDDDKEAIALILSKCYNMNGIEEARETYEREKSKTYIVAEENDIIIGIVSWIMHGTPKHGLCELDRIGVAPEKRGNGVGSALFEALIKDAENFFLLNGSQLRKIFLFTNEDNAKAIDFYKKLGFSKDALLRNHYYEGKNELVLSMFM